MRKTKVNGLLHNVAPRNWAPNSVGVGVTQWRKKRDHLSATQAVNHSTDVLGVLDHEVLL